MRATNAYGIGAWSAPLTVTTDPAAPSIANGNPTASATGVSSITWTWDAASPNGYPVTGYSFAYRLASSGSSWVQVQLSSNDLSYVSDGLSPCTYYIARVKANSSGYPSGGAWVTSSQYRTRQFPIMLGPAVQKADYGAFSNITSVWVEWSAPQTCGYAVDSYEVQYSSLGFEMNVTQSTRERLITPLASETTVSLRVRAHSTVGWGGWSEWGDFMTAAPRVPSRPGAPERVQIVESSFYYTSNATTLQLQWPAAESIGVSLQGYRLYKNGLLETTLTAPTLPSYQMRGLDPASSYEVYIVAFNDVGDSAPSVHSFFNTSAATPPSVISTPFVAEARPAEFGQVSNATSVRVGWSAPYDGGLEIQSYHVYVVDAATGQEIALQNAITSPYHLGSNMVSMLACFAAVCPCPQLPSDVNTFDTPAKLLSNSTMHLPLP